MAIIVIGSTKGGAGKSTLALNIAVVRAAQGRDVLLVDGDEQRTSTTFTNLRTKQLGAAGYTCVSIYGEALDDQVAAMAPKYDDTIVDVGGRETEALRAAMSAANTVLIPVQPRGADMWALKQMHKVIQKAHKFNPRLKVLAVLNMADPSSKDNDDTAEFIKDMPEITLLPNTVVRRKAFSTAVATARAVTELLPKDPKAIEELRVLMEALYPNG
jgi:chromosome partitioning protein